MSQRRRFSINEIKKFNFDIDALEANIEGNRYSEHTGLGIINYWLDDKLLSATLLKRVPTFINEYDLKTNQYEKRQINIFQEIIFEIDLTYKLVYTIGSQGNLPIVRSFLRSIFSDRIEFANLDFSPYKAFKLLKTEKIKFKVLEITIQEFEYFGAVGRFSAAIHEKAVVADLLTKYKEGVEKIVLHVQIDGMGFITHVYPNGVFLIVSDDSNHTDYFNSLKKILFR